MKKFTQKDMLKFEYDGETGMLCAPEGDYTNIEIFRESFEFAGNSIFGKNCKFHETAVFGENCTFGKINHMQLINMTPHAVDIIGGKTFESAGVIRVKETHEYIGKIDGIDCYTVKYEPEGNIPAYRDDVTYIVSLLVAQTFPERKDLLIPGDVVRDETGNIIGCRALYRV